MIRIRSALFLVWFLLVSLVMHLAALPLLFAPRRFLVTAMRVWAALSLFGLKWIAGLSYIVRGREHAPQGAALVAAKHFSMWETIAIVLLLDDPAVVLKRELTRIPFYGWYLRKAEMISVDRAAGGRAIRALGVAAKRPLSEKRQIVIFPEGTRRRPGDPPSFKPGVAALYAQLGMPCVPLAHNSGLFWQGWLRRPGTIVVEFLPAIPPGLPRDEFMRRLEDSIETAMSRLLEDQKI